MGMTKAQMIERYGIEYYERFKAQQRERLYKKYHEDEEKARERVRNWDRVNADHKRQYARERRAIYRINTRDTNRLNSMGLLKDGQEVHHVKYHSDKKDKSWMDDILIMTRDEHRKWHHDHPEFNALENIV